MAERNIMEYESVLPANFDGVFRFTNPSKEDFVGVWDSKEYLFPAESTTPMVIINASPLEVQHIRKKFAKDLAEREFYKSKGYKVLAAQEGKPGNRTMTGIHQAATYTLKDLEPYIQLCLKPLKAGEVRMRPIQKDPLENKLSRNEKGRLNTEVVGSGTSLKEKALILNQEETA